MHNDSRSLKEDLRKLLNSFLTLHPAQDMSRAEAISLASFSIRELRRWRGRLLRQERHLKQRKVKEHQQAKLSVVLE